MKLPLYYDIICKENCMIKLIMKLFRLQKTGKKEENAKMPTKTIKMPRSKISLNEFKNRSTVGEIKRIGKSIIIVDESGSHSLISRSRIKSLKSSALRNKKTAIIKASGLSRAQVGRIVGDLKDGEPVDVYIRKIAMQNSDRPKVTNFEILLMGGENKNEN